VTVGSAVSVSPPVPTPKAESSIGMAVIVEAGWSTEGGVGAEELMMEEPATGGAWLLIDGDREDTFGFVVNS
jgi:hypothetical protein